MLSTVEEIRSPQRSSRSGPILAKMPCTIGRRGPRTSPKVSPIIRGPKLKSDPPKKFALDPQAP